MTTKEITQFETADIYDYPGRRNESNLITDGKEVIDVAKNSTKALEEIDAYLREKGLPELKDRIPVIAYGANSNPFKLSTKFNKFPVSGTEVSESEMLTVPIVYGEISGSDVVWHGRPGQTGSYFAELYEGEETVETTVKVGVEFLTTEQLSIMHTTEGETYNVTVLKDVDLGDGNTVDALAYTAAESSILLDEQQRPISVAGIEREGATSEVMTPYEAVEYTLADAVVQAAIGEKTPEEYATEVAPMKLAEKKARQAAVQEALRVSGKSRSMRHEATDTQNYGRANFVSLPRGIHGRTSDHSIELMETSLARIRPTNEELAGRVRVFDEKRPAASDTERTRATDPIELMRFQATRDLTDPKRAEALARRLPHVKVTR